ncbi:L-ribulose-5-phosphate 4-epimerase [Lacticigenium naphthae]|uniref:L-ribulose-5-phosphate 4-epimerase n=1 Tax=Lacticigenium naphthae TaxID=515351 RepID=UPI000429C0D1|nr:L-ribulose-5-phosphate 4-epimerase [Lacticigenium naphthae]
MLEQLKKEVYEANMLLPHYDLITFTWGNVSGIDRESDLVVIKPSGVEYNKLTPEDMVVVDLNGDVVEGDLKPSSDTATHVELYKAFKDIKGVVHTHSPWAVSFAQAGINIPAAGTTQGDYYYGSIPVTREMRKDEIVSDYEKQTGTVIIETFGQKGIDPNEVPGVLVNDHGPFNWGSSPENAVHNAVVLESVAEMTYHTMQLSKSEDVSMSQDLLDKHYLRKHGKNAYYGQK